MSVDLVGPDGREYVLDNEDPAELQRALNQGFRPSAGAPQTGLEKTKAGFSEAKEALEAGAHGALQGVTAGGFGVMEGSAAKGSGEYPARDAAQRELLDREQAMVARHPVAHAVGEIGGAIASPVNKIQTGIVGGLKATTALGRIGAEVLGGGAVGTLFGAGNTLSDAALGDHDVAAEKLIAGAGLGAVLGGAGGALGGVLDEAIHAAPGLGRAISGIKEPLEDFAESRWLKAGGGIQGDIKKIPEAERAAVANVIREHMAPPGQALPRSLEEATASVAVEREATAKTLLQSVGVGDAGGLTPKMNQEEALGAIGKALEDNGARVGKALKQADSVGARPSYSETLAKYDIFEAGLNPAERGIIGGELEKVRGYLMEMGAAPVGSPKNSFSALNDLKSTIQKDTNWVADGAAKFGLKRQLAGILRDEIDTQLAPQVGSDLAKEFLDAKAAFGALSSAEKALGRKTATGADAIAALVDGASLAQPSLAGKLSALDHAATLMAHGLDRSLGNRFISASDYLTGLGAGVMHGGPLGALTGLASAVGHKMLRERGSAVIAKLADQIARSPRLSVAAQSFGVQLQTAAPHLGQYAAPLLQALSHQPAQALATHMVLAQADPHYAEAAQRAGFLPETPEEHQAALGRAGGFAGVAAEAGKTDEAITRGVEKVVKGAAPARAPGAMKTQDFGAKRMRQDETSSHQKRLDEIRQLAADPSSLLDRVTANLGRLGDVAPGVAAAVTRTAHAAVAFLATQAQQPPKAGPLADDWVAPATEMHSFALALETVQDPLSVLRHAAAGTLTEEQMRALGAVYPSLARQISNATLKQLVDQRRDVPYRARLMLGLLSGTDPDGSMGMVAANQEAIGEAGKKQPEGMGGGDSGAKGVESISVANRTATRLQQREMENAANV